jgi:hypothetical protein
LNKEDDFQEVNQQNSSEEGEENCVLRATSFFCYFSIFRREIILGLFTKEEEKKKMLRRFAPATAAKVLSQARSMGHPNAKFVPPIEGVDPSGNKVANACFLWIGITAGIIAWTRYAGEVYRTIVATPV